MALRDQPYIPLYIQDYLTDEKLNECSAATQGIYVKLMCLMHKSEKYGTILLKQKHKQNQSRVSGFAKQLLKHLPFSYEEIHEALNELVSEGVCHIKGDYLYQKRMIRDNEISIKRAKAGKKGGEKTQFGKASAKAKHQANPEGEYESENEYEDEKLKSLNKEILNFFGYDNQNNEQLMMPKYRQVKIFLNVLNKNGQIPIFEEKFKYYKLYKEKAGERIHNFNNFLGTDTQEFNDGGWNDNDWKSLYMKAKKRDDNENIPMV